MASSLSFKQVLGPSRTEGLSGLCSCQSDLRNLSSPSVQFLARPRTFKKLKVLAAGNTSGNYFRVTTYGEFRRAGVSFVMDGVPPRSQLSEADLQVDLDRIRRPGQISPLIKTDTCKILSGVHEGLTIGTPIHVFIPNPDQTGRCGYDEISVAYRPSHADLTRDMKYGIRSILKGGGIFSARETIGRVAAGAAAKKILKDLAGIEVLGYVSQVHKVVLPEDLVDHDTLTLDQIESNRVRCPDHEYAEKMIAAIHAVRVRGEDQPIGGVVRCIVRNCPRGLLGSPFFDKLGAEFAKACLSLPATKGFEFGRGLAAGTLNMKIAFKPTATNARNQNAVSTDKESELMDTCVVPRAVPMVEAQVALVLMDELMTQYA